MATFFAGARFHFYPRSPRGERRRNLTPCRWPSNNFYPRSPRGERLVTSWSLPWVASLFLSTLPARGATYCWGVHMDVRAISIHAPREGSDDHYNACTATYKPFLSTLPARGAT